MSDRITGPASRATPYGSTPAPHVALPPPVIGDVTQSPLNTSQAPPTEATCANSDEVSLKRSKSTASEDHSNDYLSLFQKTVENIEILISGQAASQRIGQLSTVTECVIALEKATALERQVESNLEILRSIKSNLENEVLSSLKSKYQGATGLFDQHQAIVNAVCGCAGLATLALGAGFIISNEHHILHGVSHLVHHWLGYGAISYGASGLTQGLAIFAQGVACFISSLIGPSLIGFIKTVGGRVVRAISPHHNMTFSACAERASADRDSFRALASSLASSMTALQPRLSVFYDQNEVLHSAISSNLLALSTRIDMDKSQITEAHDCSLELGVSEAITQIRSLNLERDLRELSCSEFRSPELIRASDGTKSRTNLGILRGLGWALSSFSSLVSSSASIGASGAIKAAEGSRDAFEDLPKNPAIDVLSGVGSGISTTLEQALKAGAQPGKTTYSFVKGLVGLAKGLLVGGEKEGPRLETLVKVMLDLSELEKGNRIRWFSKLLPSLVRAATQKPIIMEQAERMEELAGKISPKSLGTKLAEKRGTLALTAKMFSNVGKMIAATASEGVAKYGYIAPLSSIQHSPLVRRIAPSLSVWAETRLHLFQEASEEHLRKKLEKELALLPARESISKLEDDELDVYAIERYIDFLYRPGSTVSESEITALFHYWSLRRKASWHRNCESEALHRAELADLHPGFESISRVLNTRRGLFSMISHALMYGNETSMPDELTPDEALTIKFAAWAEPLDGQVVPSAPTILDTSSDGRYAVVLDYSGSLKLMQAGELVEFIRQGAENTTVCIPKHADRVRVAVSEMLLTMPLEPYQRLALLDTHRALDSRSISPQEALAHLEQFGFTAEMLCSLEQSHSLPKRGLIDLGIIG